MDVTTFVVPFCAALTFVGVSIRRAGRNPAPGMLNRAVKGAVLGTLVALVLAWPIISQYQQELRATPPHSAPELTGVQINGLAAYVAVVPLAGWVGLRMLAVRPVWLANLGAWGLTGIGLFIIAGIGGSVGGQLWVYAVLGFLSFGVAAAVPPSPQSLPKPSFLHA
ncbi:hypothetical protein QLQ12_08765 [Actinoplanes sp. NEAU-A12]|uniref:Uncharacterized protein n=1 Tax=Actinoplanes sandaracinus TaxID=3045177 RepID=A0ABT6WG51_9ACTN|nr:hypothetical protein [Actinoplanes sandaracinus]MDI6098692.1 hypothetical protein [Actinoplanes sandaracinus]